MSTPTRGPMGVAVALWLLAVVGTLFFLRSASELLIPIVIGVLISYALEPVVAWMARHRVPRLAGASLLLLSVLGLGVWGGYALKDEVLRAIEALPEAARRAREMLVSQGSDGPAASIREAAAELDGAAGQGASAEQEPAAGSVSSLAQRSVGSVFALAGHVTVVFFLVFFLLVSGHHFEARLIEIAGPDTERGQRLRKMLEDINTQIQRFLLVRLVTGIVVGAATWAVLAWLSVQNAAVWGILAGVFNSIPYFGPIIVSGGLLVVGLVQGGGMTQALQMSGAALVITSLEGWLLTPALIGKAERMSALAVFLGLLLWTWIWGAWGTLVAVPMLVIVKAVADHTPQLKPVSRLMAP